MARAVRGSRRAKRTWSAPPASMTMKSTVATYASYAYAYATDGGLSLVAWCAPWRGSAAGSFGEGCGYVVDDTRPRCVRAQHTRLRSGHSTHD